MSYLSQSLRLHFAGRFQATVSTVNNDITHFDNSTFQPNYQLRETTSNPPNNGWWNPDGDGVWRLLGCNVTTAFMSDGTAVTTDPVLSMSVADSDNSAPAKIVDLDPQQQLVSTIFGLQVRIADSSGNTLMRGQFAPVAFTDLWSKLTDAGADMAFGAMWQSVITVTEWADVSASAFLTELKAAADSNSDLLSIKFNVDCYSTDWPTAGTPGDNQFCRGRLVGTIGPATATEPRHFVLGRQLMAIQNQMLPGPPSYPNPWINYCAAVVDTTNDLIRLDLGNAVRVDSSGTVVDRGALTLVLTSPDGSTTETVSTIDYTAPGWYLSTAGIVEIPIPSNLTLDISSNALGLTLAGATGAPGVVTGEPITAGPFATGGTASGVFVRADLFVYRLSPLEPAIVTLYATQFGLPYASQTIELALNPSGLQQNPGEPNVGTPASGLKFNDSVTTDANGKAVFTLTGGNPQNSRGYIDGQVYGVGYTLSTQGNNYPVNGFNFVSVLVFNLFEPDVPIAWNGRPQGSLQPIFQQYANLYPVMARFVDLGDYNQVVSYARMLTLAFSLPEDDPNAMPVTRDLSPAKRASILLWLANPIEGSPQPAPPVLGGEVAAPPAETALSPGIQGSKALAMARRLSAGL